MTRTPYRLPQKRPQVKSGISRGPKRVWLRHRKFIRSHQCAVPGCPFPAEVAHLRTAANSGTALRPFDWDAVPLCHNHHMEAHACGHGTFEDRHRLDFAALTEALVAASPDMQMRLAMMAAGLWPPEEECPRSSVVEQRPCKTQAAGSIPAAGSDVSRQTPTETTTSPVSYRLAGAFPVFTLPHRGYVNSGDVRKAEVA